MSLSCKIGSSWETLGFAGRNCESDSAFFRNYEAVSEGYKAALEAAISRLGSKSYRQ